MKPIAKVAVTAVVMACVVAATMPWRLNRRVIALAVNDQFARAAGLDVRIDGPITLKLLPRPRLQMSQVSSKGGAGALRIDAPAVKAELDIPSLLRGRWQLASATLVDPTVTFDIDRADAIAPIGRQISRPIRISVRSGVLRTISSNPATDAVVTEIDGAVTWAPEGGAFTTSGALRWRGAPLQFAARIEHPSALAGPSGSPASLQVTSPMLTLSSDGVLYAEPRRRFDGHVAAVIASLPRLLQLPVRQARANAGRVQISGDVSVSAHGLSFSDASFRMNRSRFEGTFAIRRDEGRTAVEGTLATDLLDVDDLLAEDAGEGQLESFYRRPLGADVADADVDLRVSASVARVGRLRFDDAAFAVLLRGGRFELTVDDAGFCGGRVKGRAVAGLGPERAETHGDVSLSRVDIASLSDALGGEGHVGGALSGEATVDGRGRTLREIVAALDGHGQIIVDQGRLDGLSLGRILRRLGGRVPLQTPRMGEPTVFDRAAWSFAIDHGIVTIPETRLTAPGVAMSLSGETRLPDGRVDLRGVAVETDADGTLRSGSPRLPFAMRGSWDGSIALIGETRTNGFPALVLPLIGPMPAAP